MENLMKVVKVIAIGFIIVLALSVLYKLGINPESAKSVGF